MNEQICVATAWPAAKKPLPSINREGEREREWESARAIPPPSTQYPTPPHQPCPGLTDATYKRLPLPQIISHLIQFRNPQKHLPNFFSNCFLSLIIYDLIQCNKKKREETRQEEKKRRFHSARIHSRFFFRVFGFDFVSVSVFLFDRSTARCARYQTRQRSTLYSIYI